MIRVLVTASLTPQAREKIDENPEFEVIDGTSLSVQRFRDELASAEAIIGDGSMPLPRDLLQHARKLRIIIHAGFEPDGNIFAYARSRRIEVRHTPLAGAVSVAEYILALILETCRGLGSACCALKRNEWQPKQAERGMELFGKTVGLVGFGRVGQELASRLLALGTSVIYHDQQPITTSLPVRPVTLDELLANADILSLQMSWTKSSRPLLGTREIARLKSGAVLVNAAPAAAVDVAALLKALESGRLRAAAVDIGADEHSALRDLILHPRVFPAPHLGAVTNEAAARSSLDAVSILKEFFNV